MAKWHSLKYFICCPLFLCTLAQDKNGNYDYETADFKFMIIHKRTASWEKANQNCKEQRASLVSLDSQAKLISLHMFLLRNNFIQTEINVVEPPFIYWSSGNDLEQRGTFVWEGTGQKFDYIHWLNGQPADIENARCVQFGQGAFGRWSVKKCEAHLYYVCERPNTKITLRDESREKRVK